MYYLKPPYNDIQFCHCGNQERFYTTYQLVLKILLKCDGHKIKTNLISENLLLLHRRTELHAAPAQTRTLNRIGKEKCNN